MSPDEQQRQEMIAAAIIGEEAEKFKESDLHRTLAGMAEQQAQLALEKLVDVPASDAPEIERLQNIVKHARSFEQWLDELITEGRNAVVAYKNNQRPD